MSQFLIQLGNVYRKALTFSSKSYLLCSSKMATNKKVLCLFDVDGTLTPSRRIIDADILNFLLKEVRSKYTIALVGGSDFQKISEQMGGPPVIKEFEYVFSENGLIAHKRGEEIFRNSIQSYIGEDTLQKFINFALKYLSELTLPVKRGNFVEFRTGLINVCPVGRSCTQQERDEFGEYDKVHHVREKMVAAFNKEFPDAGLTFAIGGQISVDIFPNGWDKTYCLKHLEKDGFDSIHFYGDKTDAGGNDHEIYEHPKTIGHKVTSPTDTKKQLQELLNSS